MLINVFLFHGSNKKEFIIEKNESELLRESKGLIESEIASPQDSIIIKNNGLILCYWTLEKEGKIGITLYPIEKYYLAHHLPFYIKDTVNGVYKQFEVRGMPVFVLVEKKEIRGESLILRDYMKANDLKLYKLLYENGTSIISTYRPRFYSKFLGEEKVYRYFLD